MLGVLRNFGAATVLATWLAGCASMMSPPPEAVSGQAALDALARGDFATAEREASSAVRHHPSDPYALTALALTYELTGRPQQAVEYYQVVLALKPDGTIVLNDGVERRLIDVARVRLANLAGSERPAAAGAVSSEHAWEHAAKRFAVLRRLVDAGLATESEYEVRRKANMGALLPYSEKAPGAGLDQPPPGFEAVAERLQALGASLESRAITPREHALERVAILDALLPANPREHQAAPPALDPLVAPTYMAHLQRLRGEGLVTAEQASRERAAAERIAGPAGLPTGAAPVAAAPVAAPPAPASAKPAPPAKPTPGKTTTAPGKPTPLAKPGTGSAARPSATPATAASGQHAVHLASFSSHDKAVAGWKQLSAKYPELARMQPKIVPVDLGAKGVFHRLRAGPLASAQAAEGVCARIKAAGGECVATFY